MGVWINVVIRRENGKWIKQCHRGLADSHNRDKTYNDLIFSPAFLKGDRAHAVEEWANAKDNGEFAPASEGLVVLDLQDKVFYAFKGEDQTEQPGMLSPFQLFKNADVGRGGDCNDWFDPKVIRIEKYQENEELGPELDAQLLFPGKTLLEQQKSLSSALKKEWSTFGRWGSSSPKSISGLIFRPREFETRFFSDYPEGVIAFAHTLQGLGVVLNKNEKKAWRTALNWHSDDLKIAKGKEQEEALLGFSSSPRKKNKL